MPNPRPRDLPGFRAAVEAAFANRHAADLRWLRGPHAVTFPDARDGFIGQVAVDGRRFTVRLRGDALIATPA